MTPESVMKSYRDRTGDTDKSRQIISDQEGVNYINDGMKAFLANHPETRLAADGTLITYADADKNNMQAELCIADMYFEPLVNYVCMRRFLKDSGDSADEDRASKYLNLLTAFWTGGV